MLSVSPWMQADNFADVPIKTESEIVRASENVDVIEVTEVLDLSTDSNKFILQADIQLDIDQYGNAIPSCLCG